jgi:hypothetical protein
MSEDLVMMIVNVLIVLLGAFGIWQKVKKNIDLVKEWMDVLFAGIVSLQDGEITKDELEKIKKEFEEAKNFKVKK